MDENGEGADQAASLWPFPMVVSPVVPADVRPFLSRMQAWFDHRFGAASNRQTVTARTPWLRRPVVALVVGPTIGAILGSLMNVVGEESFNIGPVAAYGSIGLILGGASAIGTWRIRRAERWAGYVVPAARQRAVAAAMPDVGKRLAWLAYHVDCLRRHRAVREGWLPGVDDEVLDQVHFTLASDLLRTVDLRAAVAAAAGRPALASQAAERRAELATADAAFDAQVERLRSMSAIADTIAGLLGDVVLAERMDAGGPTVLELRQQLMSAPGVDLPALSYAADQALHVVNQALDPNRLYPGHDSVRGDDEPPPFGAAKEADAPGEHGSVL
jgi:hypothetical protein